MLSIYIHIPFCLKKCGYCDFYSVAMPPGKIPQERFAAAVCEELRRQVERYDLHGRKVDTIYFGGGTPTTFDPANLETILNCIHKHFSVADYVEVTIEANPETVQFVRPELVEGRKEYGSWFDRLTMRGSASRLSIVIQSFNDRFLKDLGRIHSAETARRAVKSAQDAGWGNISIDLMWGLFGQRLSDLEADLDEAISLGVQHISAYQLTKCRSVEVSKSLKEICGFSCTIDLLLPATNAMKYQTLPVGEGLCPLPIAGARRGAPLRRVRRGISAAATTSTTGTTANGWLLAQAQHRRWSFVADLHPICRC